jgi:hypothetical protein
MRTVGFGIAVMPYNKVKTALRTEKRGRNDLSFGYALVSLFDVIAASGRQNLAGLKIELKGPKIIFHANIGGQIKVDEIDISKRDYGKLLFQD